MKRLLSPAVAGDEPPQVPQKFSLITLLLVCPWRWSYTSSSRKSTSASASPPRSGTGPATSASSPACSSTSPRRRASPTRTRPDRSPTGRSSSGSRRRSMRIRALEGVDKRSSHAGDRQPTCDAARELALPGEKTADLDAVENGSLYAELTARSRICSPASATLHADPRSRPRHLLLDGCDPGQAAPG